MQVYQGTMNTQADAHVEERFTAVRATVVGEREKLDGRVQQ